MKRYRNTNGSEKSDSYFYFKKRLKSNRSRAIFVGILYLIGSIALAALACLPLLGAADAPGGVTEFYKVFTESNGFELNVKTINGILYAAMLLGVFVNVIRSLAKLGKLFKTKGTAEDGFNRNVYAMEKLGKIFSGSFAVVLVAHFLIALLCKVDTTSQVEMLMLVAVGVGVVIHLFAGCLSMKTRYYDLEDGELKEYNRMVGKVAPFFRNLLQVVAVLAMMFFFLAVNFNAPIFNQFLEENGIEKFLESPSMISVILQIVALLCTLVLVKHATATTEYLHPVQNKNTGKLVRVGGKVFRVFSLFVFITAGVAAFLSMDENTQLMENKLFVSLVAIAAIALVMFIVELIMRKRPKLLAEAEQAMQNESEAENDGGNDVAGGNMHMPGLNMAAMGKAFGMGIASGLGMGIDTNAGIDFNDSVAGGYDYEDENESKKESKKSKKKNKNAQSVSARQAFANSPAMGVIPGMGVMSPQIRPSVLPPMYPNAFPVYPPMYPPYGPMGMGAPMPYGRNMGYPRNAYNAAQLQMMMNQQGRKGKKNVMQSMPVVAALPRSTASADRFSAMHANGTPSFVINVGQDKQVLPMTENLSESEEESVETPAPVITSQEVFCPHCKTTLKVKGPNLQHRCPVCGKVFELRETVKESVNVAGSRKSANKRRSRQQRRAKRVAVR